MLRIVGRLKILFTEEQLIAPSVCPSLALLMLPPTMPYYQAEGNTREGEGRGGGVIAVTRGIVADFFHCGNTWQFLVRRIFSGCRALTLFFVVARPCRMADMIMIIMTSAVHTTCTSSPLKSRLIAPSARSS